MIPENKAFMRNHEKKDDYMKKFMLILCICATVLLSSCAIEIEDEAQFISEVSSAITASSEVNEIFFGKGLAFEDGGKTPEQLLDECKDEEAGRLLYLPVLETEKYHDKQSIMALAESAYSLSYCEYLAELGFTGIARDDEIAYYARYIESTTFGLTINVKSVAEAIPLNRTYDLSTLKIEKRKRNHVIVSVDAYENGEFCENKKFKIVKEITGWRLDWPTY